MQYDIVDYVIPFWLLIKIYKDRSQYEIISIGPNTPNQENNNNHQCSYLDQFLTIIDEYLEEIFKIINLSNLIDHAKEN